MRTTPGPEATAATRHAGMALPFLTELPPTTAPTPVWCDRPVASKRRQLDLWKESGFLSSVSSFTELLITCV